MKWNCLLIIFETSRFYINHKMSKKSNRFYSLPCNIHLEPSMSFCLAVLDNGSIWLKVAASSNNLAAFSTLCKAEGMSCFKIPSSVLWTISLPTCNWMCFDYLTTWGHIFGNFSGSHFLEVLSYLHKIGNSSRYGLHWTTKVGHLMPCLSFFMDDDQARDLWMNLQKLRNNNEQELPYFES